MRYVCTATTLVQIKSKGVNIRCELGGVYDFGDLDITEHNRHFKPEQPAMPQAIKVETVAGPEKVTKATAPAEKEGVYAGMSKDELVIVAAGREIPGAKSLTRKDLVEQLLAADETLK